jgi:ATP-dependent RNA helicase HelY
MATNLVARYEPETAHRLLPLTFAQYRPDRHDLSLERHVARNEELLAHQRDAAACDRGDVDEYRALLHAVELARRDPSRGRRTADAIDRLRPGDVIATRRGGRAVVLKHESGRSGGRVMVLGPNRAIFRLGPADFREAPRARAHVDLPKPFAPRNVTFRRAAAESLRKVRLGDPEPEPDDGGASAAETALATHPVGACPRLGVHLKAAAAAERLGRDTERLRRRVQRRSESLARQFDRVLRVLEAWDYVDGWALTDHGVLLSRIYSEADLLVAEALRRGVLDDVTPAELAALVSCFTYERRGPDADRAAPPTVWPTSRVAQRARELRRIWTELRPNEDDAGLPETRAPEPGLADAVHAWASGDALADILDEDDDLTGGDFVRNLKQVIDLLRQIALAAPVESTRATADAAADACFRGVVAASSVLP